MEVMVREEATGFNGS